MSTGPVVREELRLAIQAELHERLADTSQAKLAKRIRLKQATVSKAQRYAELGQEFAEKFLAAFHLDDEELIKKHRTRVTAWDVALLLQKNQDLFATIAAEPERWPATRLLSATAKIKRSTTFTAADGRVNVASWRAILDGADDADTPVLLGGPTAAKDEIKRQAAASRRTP